MKEEAFDFQPTPTKKMQGGKYWFRNLTNTTKNINKH
jgi:hypothetical protein